MAFGKINLMEQKVGDYAQGYLLLLKGEKAIAKSGNPYSKLTLTDGNTTVNANMFAMMEEKGVSPGMVIGVNLKCQEYNGNKSFLVDDCGPANDPSIDIGEFIEKAPIEADTMYRDILDIVGSAIAGDKSGSLVELTERIYEKYKEKLLYWSAAESIHHNMYSGLLYHTLRMMKQAQVLVGVYPSLDPELLFSAVALHDIGKLEELETDSLGSATYTVDGQLFGHALIGVQMIDAEAANGSYNAEKIKCLKHCIASHHGVLEWGAITLPHIEEAAVLHYIDLIDSRIQQYEKTSEGIQPGMMSESKVFGLDNVKVYKPTFKIWLLFTV